MKKHIKLLTIGTLLLGGLTGCNDFLDREPLDKTVNTLLNDNAVYSPFFCLLFFCLLFSRSLLIEQQTCNTTGDNH